MNLELVIESASLEETHAIGRVLGGILRAGDVVGLVGPLGAGKTNLVKGVAMGMGVADDRVVNSPTFVLVNEYAGRVRVLHLDAYRLADVEELEALGFEEMCAAGGVVLIEWADRVRRAIEPGALWIEIETVGPECRRMKLRGGPEWEERLSGSGLDQWAVPEHKSDWE